MKTFIYKDENISADGYFRKIKNEFGVPKKLLCFFCNENFLISKYNLQDKETYLVLESTTGNIIEFCNLNCGYIGTSTIRTKELLLELGLAEETATLLITMDSINIDFIYTKKSELPKISISNQILFSPTIRKKDVLTCTLNEFTYVNLLGKNITFVNPEYNNFHGLLSCAKLMHATELEYSVNEYIHDIRDASNDLNYFYSPNELRKPVECYGVNLYIRGNFFDVRCMISEKHLFSVLYTILLILKKDFVFEERLYDKKSFFSYVNIFKKNKHYRKTIELETRNEK